MTQTNRRRLLLAAAATPWLLAPARMAVAGQGQPGGARLVLVILRGGMDGLGAVPALGDPAFADARGALGRYAADPLPLAQGFALHPALTQLHAAWQRNEAVVIHAAGLPYRERSHFDAQNVLESGGTRPYELASGWLGRALRAASGKGIALQTAVPLVLRGHGAVDTWAPSTMPDPAPDLLARLDALYAGDPALAAALGRARALRADGAMAGMDRGGQGRGAAVALARQAVEFIARPDGAQAAVLELGGWDTHANQANPQGPLANSLRSLDAVLGTLHEGLAAPSAQATWRRTVVVVATEFGREVAMNGTLGTDHGTGGAAFVLGGAVEGGRMVTDWPGVAPRQRHEGRDLRITTDLRAVFKGVLHDHLRVPLAALDRDVLPDSAAVRPLSLLRA
ncbi:MAG: DUF1501 domain-containing protein [Aquabacterium sp.]